MDEHARMTEQEGMKQYGTIEMVHRGADGQIKEVRTIKNLITSAGKALAAGRLNGSGAPAAATYIAIGTSTTAAAAGDTALGAEITTGGGARANGTVSLVTTTVTNDTAQVTNTFTFTASFAVTEVGLFNAASGVTLYAHQVFSAVNVVSGDTYAVTWKVAMS